MLIKVINFNMCLCISLVINIKYIINTPAGLYNPMLKKDVGKLPKEAGKPLSTH